MVWRFNGLAVTLATIAFGAAAPVAAAEPVQLIGTVPGWTGDASVGQGWTTDQARDLLGAIEGVDRDGLRPADYQPSALRAALAGGAGPVLDAAAQASVTALAHDLLFGRIGDREAMGWRIPRSPYEALGLPAALATARADGQLGRFLAGLAPTDARYHALRDALADATDPATRDRLRVNLERARWLPRDPARDLLYVNVPSYRLQVVMDGAVASTYTVVVGAKDTPTPALISPTSSLVVNPWWNVPTSIVRKDGLRPGRAGFQYVRRDGGDWAVRQPPGPRNALGRIKFNLVNDQAIYLHDTPAKTAFARPTRALSHGCVRVKDIDRLAAELMEAGGAAPELDAALATRDTATLRLPQTWPVWIVYFTADLDGAGRLASFPDPYGYDAQVLAGLDGPKMQMASLN